MGGFVEQNRKPDNLCFVYEGNAWRRIAPLPRPFAAIGCAALDGMIHCIGGAVGDTFPDKKSVDWHLVYDPRIDQWSTRRPMPTGRDHTGTLTVEGRIHVIGGRVDSFHTNSNLHHVYEPKEDKWTPRAPLPTARSGHGAVLMGGIDLLHGRRRHQPRVRAERGLRRQGATSGKPMRRCSRRGTASARRRSAISSMWPAAAR